MIKLTAVVLVLTLAMLGCAQHIVSSHETFQIPHTAIGNLDQAKPVTVINAQENNDDILIMALGARKLYGNMKQWSETAVRYVEIELDYNRIPLSESSQKTIGVKVLGSNCFDEGSRLRCKTKMQIELGDSGKKIFIGDDSSKITLKRAVEGSIMRAVSAMFQDGAVVEYLRGNE